MKKFAKESIIRSQRLKLFTTILYFIVHLILYIFIFIHMFVRSFVDWLVGLVRSPSLSLCDIVFFLLLSCARCRVLFISFIFPVSNLNNLNDLHCCFNKLFVALSIAHSICVCNMSCCCVQTARANGKVKDWITTTTPPPTTIKKTIHKQRHRRNWTSFGVADQKKTFNRQKRVKRKNRHKKAHPTKFK